MDIFSDFGVPRRQNGEEIPLTSPMYLSLSLLPRKPSRGWDRSDGETIHLLRQHQHHFSSDSMPYLPSMARAGPLG